jgi:uroporphyrinogen-III synthase
MRLALERAGWVVHAQSLIDIIPVKFLLPNEPLDWVFFSSSHGADLFLHNYTGSHDFKIGAVGLATAEVVRSHGFECNYVAQSGNMNEVALELAAVVKGGKVLFAGAESGSSRVRSGLLPEQITLLTVYRTEPILNANIPLTDVVYLTSPSNAKTYLAQNTIAQQTWVAIGQTTADFLTEKGIARVLLPRSPQQADVLNLLLSL